MTVMTPSKTCEYVFSKLTGSTATPRYAGAWAGRPYRCISMIRSPRDLSDNRRLTGHNPLQHQFGHSTQAPVWQQSRDRLQELVQTVLQFAFRQLGKEIVIRYAQHCSAPGKFGGCNYQMYRMERSLSTFQTCG